MIKRITRKKLDVEKYTNCLNTATNYRIYAEYWYLDALVGDNWDCYILNDYEAVMPLPYTKKLGIKFITQPIYCQQLGVFHGQNFSRNNFQKFEKKLHRNLVRGYSFNEENTEMYEPKGTSKINQILKLNTDYQSLFSKLRKNRKQEIKIGLPDDYKIIENKYGLNFIELLENNYKNIEKELQINKLKKLVNRLQKNEKSITISILVNEKTIGSSFYIFSNQRIIQLCNAKNNNTKLNTNTFIVDFIIKKNLQSELVLDFEGSSLKGVNEFNTSFRAETKFFTVYKNIKL